MHYMELGGSFSWGERDLRRHMREYVCACVYVSIYSIIYTPHTLFWPSASKGKQSLVSIWLARRSRGDATTSGNLFPNNLVRRHMHLLLKRTSIYYTAEVPAGSTAWKCWSLITPNRFNPPITTVWCDHKFVGSNKAIITRPARRLESRPCVFSKQTQSVEKTRRKPHGFKVVACQQNYKGAPKWTWISLNSVCGFVMSQPSNVDGASVWWQHDQPWLDKCKLFPCLIRVKRSFLGRVMNSSP